MATMKKNLRKNGSMGLPVNRIYGSLYLFLARPVFSITRPVSETQSCI